MMSLESFISSDNSVRVIDLFVDRLDLRMLGFKKADVHFEGRPPYRASDMLKLYYYGYLNRVRSSRRLEAECMRNVEVWWLLHQQTPGYHTIADFRKDNVAALKEAFKMFVCFLKGEDMFDGKLIAADGTKIRAQNNRKNTFNKDKLAKSLAYIEDKTEQYVRELESCDMQEDKEASAAAALKKKDVAEKLEVLKERKKHYEQLQDKLNNSDEKQISLVDVQSRLLPIKDDVTNVCYNIQTAADSKHSLIVEFDTINTTDQGQLSNIAGNAMKALQTEDITVLADKGYHTGKDLQQCKDKHITTIVAYPQRGNKNTAPAYQTDKFIYSKQNDTYTCPQGALLTTSGNLYEKKTKGRASYMVKRYQTAACCACPFRNLCTKATNKVIERSDYQDVTDENNERVNHNLPLYKKRQQIIEHPFGTIKRSWGYSYTLLKGIKKVNAEMAIIFTVYNIRRVISILGVKTLIERLKEWKMEVTLQKQTFLFDLLLYSNRCYAIAA